MKGEYNDVIWCEFLEIWELTAYTNQVTFTEYRIHSWQSLAQNYVSCSLVLQGYEQESKTALFGYSVLRFILKLGCVNHWFFVDSKLIS